MEINQIIELMKAVADNGLTDFSYEENGVVLKIRKRQEKKLPPPPGPGMMHPMPPMPGMMPPMPPMQGMMPPMPPMQGAAPMGMAPAAEPAAVAPEKAEGQVVKSPLVGTYYEASAPGADPFVRVGDKVKQGQVLGIVEAMKLMNEIESDFDGIVKEILVKNGDVIEYDQPLFIIE